jgi:hypothetical protein
MRVYNDYSRVAPGNLVGLGGVPTRPPPARLVRRLNLPEGPSVKVSDVLGVGEVAKALVGPIVDFATLNWPTSIL